MDSTIKRKLTGRCPKCDVRYVWPAHKCKLRDAGCPECGTRLWATTHMFKRGPTREIECPRVIRIEVKKEDLPNGKKDETSKR